MTQSEIDAAAEPTDFDIAIERLTAWVRDYGEAKPKVFIGDVSMLLLAAREARSDRAARLAQEREDAEPITIERLQSVGFGDETINGVSMLIDSGIGDPVELYLQIELSGHWEATLCQSNRNDMVSITGRHYETMGDVRRLMEALKGTP